MVLSLPEEWQDILAEQPSHALDLTVLTQAALDSVLMTTPSSVANGSPPYQ
jgi:hypothetical protein